MKYYYFFLIILISFYYALSITELPQVIDSEHLLKTKAFDKMEEKYSLENSFIINDSNKEYWILPVYTDDEKEANYLMIDSNSNKMPSSDIFEKALKDMIFYNSLDRGSLYYSSALSNYFDAMQKKLSSYLDSLNIFLSSPDLDINKDLKELFEIQKKDAKDILSIIQEIKSDSDSLSEELINAESSLNVSFSESLYKDANSFNKKMNLLSNKLSEMHKRKERLKAKIISSDLSLDKKSLLIKMAFPSIDYDSFLEKKALLDNSFEAILLAYNKANNRNIIEKAVLNFKKRKDRKDFYDFYAAENENIKKESGFASLKNLMNYIASNSNWLDSRANAYGSLISKVNLLLENEKYKDALELLKGKDKEALEIYKKGFNEKQSDGTNKKNFKKYLIYLLAGIIFLIILKISYAYYKNKSSKKDDVSDDNNYADDEISF